MIAWQHGRGAAAALAVGVFLVSWMLPPAACAGLLEEAEALMKAGQYDDARSNLVAAAKRPELEGRAVLLLARICNAQEEWQQGVEYGERAVELLPDNSEAHFAYAVALRIKLSNISKIRAIFSAGAYKKALYRALELDPDNLDAREEEIGFLFQAPGIAGGDPAKARQRVEELKRIDWRRGSLVGAEMLQAIGDEEEAGAIYREMVAKDPDDATARAALALWHARHEEFEEADRHLELLAGDEQEDLALGVRYQLARSRVVGKYDQERAVALLKGYLDSLDDADRPGLPSRSAAWWRLGMAHEQLGAVAAAREAYRRALALDADNDEARKALAGLGKPR